MMRRYVSLVTVAAAVFVWSAVKPHDYFTWFLLTTERKEITEIILVYGSLIAKNLSLTLCFSCSLW
jgi:uncharacterized membrane protein YjdF